MRIFDKYLNAPGWGKRWGVGGGGGDRAFICVSLTVSTALVFMVCVKIVAHLLRN